MWTAGWRIIWKKIVTVIDATFAVAKRKPEEIQACQDSNPWPLWYWCIALPVELTSQLGAGRWISSYYTRKTMYDFHIFITSSSSFHGFNTNQFNKAFWWLERNLKLSLWALTLCSLKWILGKNHFPLNCNENLPYILVVEVLTGFHLSFICMFLYFRFPSDVESGLVEIVSPSTSFYPDLEAVPLTFGDSRERVK